MKRLHQRQSVNNKLDEESYPDELYISTMSKFLNQVERNYIEDKGHGDVQTIDLHGEDQSFTSDDIRQLLPQPYQTELLNTIEYPILPTDIQADEKGQYKQTKARKDRIISEQVKIPDHPERGKSSNPLAIGYPQDGLDDNSRNIHVKVVLNDDGSDVMSMNTSKLVIQDKDSSSNIT